MALEQPTKDLLAYLRRNPQLRAQIRAAPNKTLLYAGGFFKPIWKELADLKRTNQQVALKEMLPEVLARLQTPGGPFPTLLAWVQSIDSISPWQQNGFIAWRAVSGIFAANAIGTVSFYVGSPVSAATKVFAATELPVLLRNINVDAQTKDILAYYDRCLKGGQPDLNFGFIGG